MNVEAPHPYELADGSTPFTPRGREGWTYYTPKTDWYWLTTDYTFVPVFDNLKRPKTRKPKSLAKMVFVANLTLTGALGGGFVGMGIVATNTQDQVNKNPQVIENTRLTQISGLLGEAKEDLTYLPPTNSTSETFPNGLAAQMAMEKAKEKLREEENSTRAQLEAVQATIPVRDKVDMVNSQPITGQIFPTQIKKVATLEEEYARRSEEVLDNKTRGLLAKRNQLFNWWLKCFSWTGVSGLALMVTASVYRAKRDTQLQDEAEELSVLSVAQ